uniref:DUF834 domain-containing protein n=1 Tax=Oryza brachyantha TaxID=4533 RepID=J3KVC8_ORYBR
MGSCHLVTCRNKLGGHGGRDGWGWQRPPVEATLARVGGGSRGSREVPAWGEGGRRGSGCRRGGRRPRRPGLKATDEGRGAGRSVRREEAALAGDGEVEEAAGEEDADLAGDDAAAAG